MRTSRRDLLLGAPLGALGMGIWDSLLDAQDSTSSGPDPGVLDFWVKRMGVPAAMIPGGEKVASGESSRDINASNSGYGREPLFYYLDERSEERRVGKEGTATGGP